MHSELNLPCPYKVFRIQENDSLAHYEFTTSFGITYYIHFDTCDFFPDVISEDQLFSFSFGPKSVTYSTDEKVKLTLIEVIKLFFKNREHVLLFTCDSTDGKAESRQRLFGKWHSIYSKSIGTVKVDTVIYDPDPDTNNNYLCSLIIRRDHPNITECIKAFEELDAYFKSLK